MNNLNNMAGMPMGGQQQQRAGYPLQFQNPQSQVNPKPIDYTWQAGYSREARDNMIKNM